MSKKFTPQERYQFVTTYLDPLAGRAAAFASRASQDGYPVGTALALKGIEAVILSTQIVSLDHGKEWLEALAETVRSAGRAAGAGGHFFLTLAEDMEDRARLLW